MRKEIHMTKVQIQGYSYTLYRLKASSFWNRTSGRILIITAFRANFSTALIYRTGVNKCSLGKQKTATILTIISRFHHPCYRNLSCLILGTTHISTHLTDHCEQVHLVHEIHGPKTLGLQRDFLDQLKCLPMCKCRVTLVEAMETLGNIINVYSVSCFCIK